MIVPTLFMHVASVTDAATIPVGTPVKTMCGKTKRRRRNGATRPFACRRCFIASLADYHDRRAQFADVLERFELGGKITKASLEGLQEVRDVMDRVYAEVDALLPNDPEDGGR